MQDCWSSGSSTVRARAASPPRWPRCCAGRGWSRASSGCSSTTRTPRRRSPRATRATRSTPPRSPRGSSGDLVLAAVPGGLLGAITSRYTVRDLAAELRLPVVLVAPADPDATNLVRLSLAAARAARLVVAAVVLTGWPDPPEPRAARRAPPARRGRRRRRAHAARVPRRPRRRRPRLADRRLARRRPARARARRPRPSPHAPARAAGAAPSHASGRRSSPTTPGRSARPATRAPRRARASWRRCWRSSPPRGRCVASRAYTLYNRASGGKKLTTTARAPLSRARCTGSRRSASSSSTDDVARLPDQPAVRVRELGDRVLEEVPLDEIAELMRRLGGPDKRAVLSHLRPRPPDPARGRVPRRRDRAPVKAVRMRARRINSPNGVFCRYTGQNPIAMTSERSQAYGRVMRRLDGRHRRQAPRRRGRRSSATPPTRCCSPSAWTSRAPPRRCCWSSA